MPSIGVFVKAGSVWRRLAGEEMGNGRGGGNDKAAAGVVGPLRGDILDSDPSNPAGESGMRIRAFEFRRSTSVSSLVMDRFRSISVSSLVMDSFHSSVLSLMGRRTI